MDEFEDWLSECYRTKEISDKELIELTSNSSYRLLLWEDFIDSFTNDEKETIVLHGVKLLMRVIAKNLNRQKE